MSPAVLAGLVVAGAGGALARYLVTRAVQARTRSALPWGTFVVNVTGALLLGLLTGAGLHHGLAETPRIVLGAGFCGAFTTFSTLAVETVRLVETGSPGAALRHLVGSTAAGLIAAAAGLAISAAM
ncbi:MAG TPA: fluoride efflux transporter CrcB [Acidimicrobiales bacterium]|nr:fluoride efflux transporter CrcB [Acidimicrobiales bacterium]